MLPPAYMCSSLRTRILAQTLSILSLFILSVQTAQGFEAKAEDPAMQQLLYIKSLYQQRDYHRSISEILRLQFMDIHSPAQKETDLYLLKSYYKIGDFASVTRTANDLLVSRPAVSSQQKSQIGILMTAAALGNGSEQQARAAWETYVKTDEAEVFPASASTPGLVDPETASFYSSILPGTGMLVSGQNGRAATSLLLNLLFIYGSYAAIVQEQYGLAGLLVFFEINWYFGGKKASAEAAKKYNRDIISRRQNNWLNIQLQRNGLSDVSEH